VLNSSAEVVTGGAGAGLMLSEPVAGIDPAGSVVSRDVRAVAGGADTGSVVSRKVRAVAGGADAGSVVSEDVLAVVARADGTRVSVLVPAASSVLGDDLSCASVVAVSDRRTLVEVRRSPLRNRRHVWELCSAADVLGPTAGFAPSASDVSVSS
jgi:hypothetical protein